MDLQLDRTQTDFTAAVRRFARQYAEGNDPATEVHGDYGPQVPLEELASLGLAGLTLPEEVDGAGGSVLDLCLALEELGRAGITSPLVTSTGLVASLLTHDEAGERELDVLRAIAAGETVATIALLTPESSSEWAWSPSPTTPAGEGWTLNATYSQVPYAHLAEWLVVVAALESRDPSLVLLHVPSLPAGTFATRAQRVIGGAPRDHVTLTGVPVSAAELVALPAGASLGSRIEEALLTAALLQTAHTIGAGEAALDLAVTWAKDRQQFGRPIGSFQMVSHRCAEIRLALDPARLLLWEAAWALDAGREDAAELVAVAKSYLTETCADIATHAHQVMGAIGYSVEHPMHVHTRSIKAFQNTFGSSAQYLERIAVAIGL